ncbi:hypothetical protein GCM10007977_001260 [Dactylosporangium sucinum]|uniref:Uncharacterized protein n=1 Tax=Dactylosporangium sucinum TaxID=1424081 RepID=A0A917SZG9_9ACTN|nr:hypothetical protein GCM10007977_001260 [Dactylosporangium sucinum]
MQRLGARQPRPDADPPAPAVRVHRHHAGLRSVPGDREPLGQAARLGLGPQPDRVDPVLIGEDLGHEREVVGRPVGGLGAGNGGVRWSGAVPQRHQRRVRVAVGADRVPQDLVDHEVGGGRTGRELDNDRVRRDLRQHRHGAVAGRQARAEPGQPGGHLVPGRDPVLGDEDGVPRAALGRSAVRHGYRLRLLEEWRVVAALLPSDPGLVVVDEQDRAAVLAEGGVLPVAAGHAGRAAHHREPHTEVLADEAEEEVVVRVLGPAPVEVVQHPVGGKSPSQVGDQVGGAAQRVAGLALQQLMHGVEQAPGRPESAGPAERQPTGQPRYRQARLDQPQTFALVPLPQGVGRALLLLLLPAGQRAHVARPRQALRRRPAHPGHAAPPRPRHGCGVASPEARQRHFAEQVLDITVQVAREIQIGRGIPGVGRVEGGPHRFQARGQAAHQLVHPAVERACPARAEGADQVLVPLSLPGQGRLEVGDELHDLLLGERGRFGTVRAQQLGVRLHLLGRRRRDGQVVGSGVEDVPDRCAAVGTDVGGGVHAEQGHRQPPQPGGDGRDVVAGAGLPVPQLPDPGDVPVLDLAPRLRCRGVHDVGEEPREVRVGTVRVEVVRVERRLYRVGDVVARGLQVRVGRPVEARDPGEREPRAEAQEHRPEEAVAVGAHIAGSLLELPPDAPVAGDLRLARFLVGQQPFVALPFEAGHPRGHLRVERGQSRLVGARCRGRFERSERSRSSGRRRRCGADGAAGRPVP